MSPDRTGVAVNQALQRTLGSACASELRTFGNSGVLMNKKYQLAVDGTLMRGLPLNENLVKVGATFRREMKTSDCYRLWSINDRYPGMLRTTINPRNIGRTRDADNPEYESRTAKPLASGLQDSAEAVASSRGLSGRRFVGLVSYGTIISRIDISAAIKMIKTQGGVFGSVSNSDTLIRSLP
jgi:hypothetical protein